MIEINLINYLLIQAVRFLTVFKPIYRSRPSGKKFKYY